MSFVAAVLLCTGAQQVQAQVTAEVTCDIDQNGTPETIQIFNNRRAQVKVNDTGRAKKVTFGKRYPADQWTASCADRNDDGKLDLVLTNNTTSKTKAFSFYSASGSFSACSSIQPWPGTLIYKTVGSDHFVGDPRRFAVNVVAKFGFNISDSCIQIYATDGTLLGQMGYYGRWVGGPARWYGPTGCGNMSYPGSSLASRANKAANNPNIIAKIGNSCFGPIPANVCRGSKGC
jgi:hypothetical protein